MTTTDNAQDQYPEPITEEARALHGDQAQPETHEQPEAVVLPAGTRIAAPAETED